MAFLVRLWQPGHNGEPVWHASVDNPHTAERHYFADLAALFAFFEEQTTACVSPANLNHSQDSEEIPQFLAEADQRREP